MSQRNDEDRITRRGLLQVGSATLATAATLKVAAAQDLAKSAIRSSDHHLPNESVPGPRNSALEAENRRLREELAALRAQGAARPAPAAAPAPGGGQAGLEL